MCSRPDRYSVDALGVSPAHLQQIDVSVNAPDSGTIKELLVSEEDTVTVGQELAKLELGGAPEAKKDDSPQKSEQPAAEKPKAPAEPAEESKPSQKPPSSEKPAAPKPEGDKKPAPEPPQPQASDAAKPSPTGREERRVRLPLLRLTAGILHAC